MTTPHDAHSTGSGPSDTEEVVRRYFAVVADLGSSEADLRALLSPSVRVTEHPNAITPHGAVRTVEESVSGFHAGKRLLSDQAFTVHEVLASGERAAVRATWTGTVGVDAGPLTRGTRLVAHIAGFLTVRGGQVVAHETFDCYEPFA
jgi:ketosteroid isomerase-like protein